MSEDCHDVDPRSYGGKLDEYRGYLGYWLNGTFIVRKLADPKKKKRGRE